MSDTIELLTHEQPGTLEIETEWHVRSERVADHVVDHFVRGRIIPFGEPSVVVERGERFREQFLRGCLTKVCQTAARIGNVRWIGLNLDHDESLDSRIGVATSIEQLDDGGWSEFKLYRGPQREKVLSILEESHNGLSVMFSDVAAPQLIDGIRSRTQIHVHHVAATPIPTYSGARIMSIRDPLSANEPLTDEELRATPALDEWTAYLDSLHPSS